MLQGEVAIEHNNRVHKIVNMIYMTTKSVNEFTQTN